MSDVEIINIEKINSDEYWVTFEFEKEQKFVEGFVLIVNGKSKGVNVIGEGKLSMAENIKIGFKATKAVKTIN